MTQRYEGPFIQPQYLDGKNYHKHYHVATLLNNCKELNSEDISYLFHSDSSYQDWLKLNKVEKEIYLICSMNCLEPKAKEQFLIDRFELYKDTDVRLSSLVSKYSRGDNKKLMSLLENLECTDILEKDIAGINGFLNEHGEYNLLNSEDKNQLNGMLDILEIDMDSSFKADVHPRHIYDALKLLERCEKSYTVLANRNRFDFHLMHFQDMEYDHLVNISAGLFKKAEDNVIDKQEMFEKYVNLTPDNSYLDDRSTSDLCVFNYHGNSVSVEMKEHYSEITLTKENGKSYSIKLNDGNNMPLEPDLVIKTIDNNPDEFIKCLEATNRRFEQNEKDLSSMLRETDFKTFMTYYNDPNKDVLVEANEKVFSEKMEMPRYLAQFADFDRDFH